MPLPQLDLIEAAAASDAGAEAGQYLDEIGQTDLAKLEGDQWSEFLRRVVIGYEKGLRTRILTATVPF